MRTPKQVTGVHRDITALAQSASGNVLPSFGWGDLLNIAKTVAPIVAKAAPVVAGLLA